MYPYAYIIKTALQIVWFWGEVLYKTYNGVYLIFRFVAAIWLGKWCISFIAPDFKERKRTTCIQQPCWVYNLVLALALCSTYYLHFLDGESECHCLCNLPKVIQLVNVEVKLKWSLSNSRACVVSYFAFRSDFPRPAFLFSS